MYTLWLLIQLHESDSGKRYSRYLHLCMEAFGMHHRIFTTRLGFHPVHMLALDGILGQYI